MSLVDGPTGQELAREELTDPIYADAQPSLIERVIEWLVETVSQLLDTAEGAPGGSWVLAIVATAGIVCGIWLIARWRTSPGRSKGEIFEDADKRPAVDFLAEAQSRLAIGDWRQALVAATRAIVGDLQATSRVADGPGITIADVRKAVPDPVLAQTLTDFERVQYGGGNCLPEQARAAMELAVHGVPEKQHPVGGRG